MRHQIDGARTPKEKAPAANRGQIYRTNLNPVYHDIPPISYPRQEIRRAGGGWLLTYLSGYGRTMTVWRQHRAAILDLLSELGGSLTIEAADVVRGCAHG